MDVLDSIEQIARFVFVRFEAFPVSVVRRGEQVLWRSRH
jgi:hypothetical protein